MTSPENARIANVVGLGLIGSSIAAGLSERGWTVHGDDLDPDVVAEAHQRGLIAAAGLNAAAQITFVAVPVSQIPEQVARALGSTEGVVTDVGSVKASICATVVDDRFIGGHPMAGSEADGIDGADPNMFEGAIWVLTPVTDSDDEAFTGVAAVVRSLGAEVVALAPERHDALVAIVSHVPHLTAATLMSLAAQRSQEHATLLRLAAGGFRDMTRIAGGRTDIWLDICSENREAISASLDELIAGLSEVRRLVAEERRTDLGERLQAAREARINLPGRVTDPTVVVEFRIPIPDRAGAAAEVFTLAADLGVNIANFEVVHLAESARGVAVVLVDESMTELFRGGLIARGFRPSVSALG